MAFNKLEGRQALVSNRTALVAGASSEEFAHLQRCLSEWECVNAPLKNMKSCICPIGARPTLAILFAQKDEKNTLTICEQIRNSPENADVPILLIISRYEIIQGNAITRKGNATFLIAPFNEQELRDTCNGLLEGFSFTIMSKPA